jgi:hypothetical protein
MYSIFRRNFDKYILSIIFFTIFFSATCKLSAEEILNLQEFKTAVPTQKSGKFLSPFANPNYGEPAKIRVGFLLKSISSYSIKEAKFNADFYISYTSDKPMPLNIMPRMTNGYIEENEHIILISNLPTFKLWKIHGTFYSNPDLRNYPFDTQELRIEIEEDDAGIDQINFIADPKRTNMDVDFFMPGWEVNYLESRTVRHYYPDRFDNDDLYYPRYVFHLGIKRYASNALFTVYFPAFVIMFVSLSGIWLNKKHLDTRINSSAPMLASAVLFHYTIVQGLPPTAYLTGADKIMIAVYCGLMINLIATWCFFFIDEKYHNRIYMLGKYLVPPLNILLFLLGALL